MSSTLDIALAQSQTQEVCTDQAAAFERAMVTALAAAVSPVPVTVWGDNTLAISQAPAVVYVHAEKESAADLGRQTLKAAVTVKTAATVDTSRQQLDQLCAAVEQAAAAADLPLGTGCAVMAEGFGPVFYEKDSYSCRSLALRVFIRF